MLGAASQEYSVAYFGFDSASVMEQFIEKYDNFVVEVDNKRKYSLEVSRAWYQPMPTLLKNGKKAQATPVEDNKKMIDTSAKGTSPDTGIASKDQDGLQLLE